jgi:uncharacterized membrane protein YoaK (UPF0700 family)
VRRPSPSAVRDLLLIGLTFSSGAVDAISFLALGKVFTAFMTGNVVFLGFLWAGANGPGVARVVAALAAFGAGVFLATRIVRPSKGSGLWPGRVSVALGVAALWQVAFLAIWATADGRPSSGTAAVLVGVSALAMGMHSGAVLSLGVRGVFTTAATATLMFLSSDFPESAAERMRLAGVLVALLAGAVAGGVLLIHARVVAPVLPLVTSALVVGAATISLPGRTTAKRPTASPADSDGGLHGA